MSLLCDAVVLAERRLIISTRSSKLTMLVSISVARFGTRCLFNCDEE
jgi:hypothetical protein